MWFYWNEEESPEQNKLTDISGDPSPVASALWAQGAGGSSLWRSGDDGFASKGLACLPCLQNRPLFSTKDSKHHHLRALSPQDWPCAPANSTHRPHCLLNLKKTRRHAQQLVHKTLITVPLLERLLTSEGVTHRRDGKTLMGQHVAGPHQGRGPLALGPPVLFQASSRLWFPGY